METNRQIPKSRISVVMTTWNGAEHIEKQLNSILHQSRQADEVIIFDDGSTDQTVEIVREFINDNSLNSWSFKINEKNLGWKRNFIEAMRVASGDYIFPCDQDDIWYPEKLAEMEKAMEENPDILLLACDYNVIYEPGAIPAKVYKKTKKERRGLIAKYGFTKHFFMNPNPGCSYAVRKSFFDDVNGLWFDGAPHDEFLWLMATIQDGAWFYNRELMDYIRYAGNASSIRYKDIPMQIQNLTYIAHMLDQMEKYAFEHSALVNEKYLKHIRIAQVWCKKRHKIMQTRSLWRWLLLFPLWGYYNSFKNCLSDLWLILLGKFKRS